MDATVEHAHSGNRLYFLVWFWLLALTLLEVFLAYRQLPLMTMLFLLMGLSLIKAALIIAYFMHLRFEKRSLALTLIPPLVICVILLMVFFFPDSLRLLELRPS
ncbi:MAG TPA: cytochrome C oxidase subunit IV family protein [Bryobacterales bacterium]|jgi:cytochrome c oxidase subunit 4|nr:cytochrome C oxidase subunit IV family protein [Bryobacterales bacterium]